MRNRFARARQVGALFFLIVFMTGCYAHSHVVGDGPQRGLSTSTKQWYLVYGLAPLSEVDTRDMAEGAEDYLIETEQSFVDSIIGAVTFGLIAPRTVTVTR